jgi:hypothetical protein
MLVGSLLFGPRLKNWPIDAREHQLPSTGGKDQKTRLALFERFSEGRVAQPYFNFAGAD